jgi:hypothetical protein
MLIEPLIMVGAATPARDCPRFGPPRAGAAASPGEIRLV